MSFDTAKKAIDFYLSRADHKKEATLSFYGGEPLLGFKVIEQCVKYVKQNWPDRAFVVALTTNGTLLTDRIIPFLVEHDFRYSKTMTVSISGKWFHSLALLLLHIILSK
jgi:uncharacterized protein